MKLSSTSNNVWVEDTPLEHDHAVQLSLSLMRSSRANAKRPKTEQEGRALVRNWISGWFGFISYAQCSWHSQLGFRSTPLSTSWQTKAISFS